MFHKGTLKSYDSANEVGVILLSEKELELHFTLQDFPNPTLEPQLGERVKCLIEQTEDKATAKFIVRLDYKNARTETPRNKIFYSEDEDLDVLKKAQAEKEIAQQEQDEKLRDQQLKSKTIDAKKTSADQPQPNSKIDKNSNLNQDLDIGAQKQASNFAEENAVKLDQTKTPEIKFEVVDHLAKKNKIEQSLDSTDSSETESNSSSIDTNKTPDVIILPKKEEPAIPQSAPLSGLTKPVDVHLEGMIDLSHTSMHDEDDPFAALISSPLSNSHTTKSKSLTAQHLSIDAFEQLQQEQINTRHTTSTPDHSSNNNYQDNNNSIQEGDSALQKAKTQLAYRTNKSRAMKGTSLNFNPWILIGVISLLVLAALGYFGYERYLKHKAEQDAKAKYYLLEQQKAIEDQRQKMAKLSDKPIIPEERRKELLGDQAK